MCFQVYFKPSHRYIEKGIGVFDEDKGFHSVTHPSPSLRASLHLWGREHESKAKGLRLWYNLHSFTYDQRGREYYKRALMIPFLAIHAKGGESMSPKQKDRTTTNFKNVVFQICDKKSFFYWYLIFYTISNWYTLFKINI